MINRQLWIQRHQYWANYSGFTLKIDNEIEGRSTATTLMHASVLNASLSHRKTLLCFKKQQTKIGRFPFYLKRKKKLPLFFFLIWEAPVLLAFLFYLISFLRSKVTYSGSILEVHSASNAHTLLAPMGFDPHLSRLVTSITNHSMPGTQSSKSFTILL